MRTTKAKKTATRRLVPKHLYTLPVDLDGQVQGIGRVDTFEAVIAQVQENAAAGLRTEVRLLDLGGIEKIVKKLMRPRR